MGNVSRRCTGRAVRPVPRTPLDRVAIQRSRTSRSTLFFSLAHHAGLGPPRLLGQLFFSPTAQAVGWEKYLQLQTDESCIRFLLQQRHFVAATAVIFCYDQRVFCYILFLLSISCPNKKSCNRLHESFNPTFKKLQPVYIKLLEPAFLPRRWPWRLSVAIFSAL